MKKNILFIATLLAAVGFTSCSSDDLSVPAGGAGNATFTVTAPGAPLTRFGEGTQATQLTYAVYYHGTKEKVTEGTETLQNKKATVNLNLVRGKSYDIAFWAQDPAATYHFDTATQEVTGIYTDLASNNEARDAFFKTVEVIDVDGAVNETVELRRPFAQINVGTSDLAAAEVADIVQTLQAGITVKDVPSVLNVVTGEATQPVDVAFTLATPPTQAFPKTGYSYLSMAYILLGADKTTKDVSLVMNNGVKTVVADGTPVQRNYRTNIYGALLTAPGQFDVEVIDGFAGDDNDVEVLAPAGKVKVGATLYDNLDAALQAVQGQDAAIALGEGTYEVSSLSLGGAHTLSITGSSYKTVLNMTDPGNTMKRVNAGSDNVTLKNLSVSVGTEGTSGKGIETTGKVTMDNCKVTGTLFGQATQALYKDCIFEVEGAGNYNVWPRHEQATFQNCTFRSQGKGILFYNGSGRVSETTFDNCTFVASQPAHDGKAAVEIDSRMAPGTYKVNLNGCKSVGYEKGTLSNNTLWNHKKGNTPVEIRVDGVLQDQGVTMNGYVGETTDDRTKVTTCTFTITSAKGLQWLAYRANNKEYYDGEATPKVKVFKDEKIVLAGDINMQGVAMEPIYCWGVGQSGEAYTKFFRGTFDGQGHTISNLKVESVGKANGFDTAGLFGAVCDGTVQDVKLKNVSIRSSHYAGGVVGYMLNGYNTTEAATVKDCEVDGGTITSAPELISGAYDNGDKVGGIAGYLQAHKQPMNITGCTVKNVTITAYRDMGGILGYGAATASPLTVKDNTVSNVTLVQDNTHAYKTEAITTVDDVYGKMAGTKAAESVTTPNTVTGVTKTTK